MFCWNKTALLCVKKCNVSKLSTFLQNFVLSQPVLTVESHNCDAKMSVECKDKANCVHEHQLYSLCLPHSSLMLL